MTFVYPLEMKKMLDIFFVYGFLFLISVFSSSNAQSLTRQTTASSGNYVLSDGTLIQQTIGQPYNTETFYSEEISYRPGFQQPVFGIVQLKSDISLKIFPNPAANYVTIEALEIVDDVALSLIDNLGKLILSEHIAQLKSHRLDCTNLANGPYFINVTNPENKTFSAKLIINR